jgi:hypothetical protein
MYIPLWALGLLAATLYILFKATWKVAYDHGVECGREDADIERNTQELREALWPIRRRKIVKGLADQGETSV